MENEKNVYLMHCSYFNKKYRFINFKDNIQNNVVCFCRDIDILNKINADSTQKIKYIDINQLLKETSERLRRPYIDYIGTLSVENTSFEWWTSRIAEKNTFESPLFLYICYLEVFKHLLKNELVNENNNVYVISESVALLELVYQLLKNNNNYKIKVLFKINDYVNRIKIIPIALYRIVKFLNNEIFKKILCKIISSKEKLLHNEEYIFIRTWVSRGFVLDDHTVNDRYFGILSKFLWKKGLKVRIIPIVYSTNNSYGELLKYFRKNKDKFIIPNDYYRTIDFIKIIMINLKQINNLNKKKYFFESNNILLLIKEELLRSLLCPGIMELNLFYYFIERLHNEGIKISKIIYTFENMFHEKSLLLGVQKYYPKTKTIGYQHSVLYPMELCQYMSVYEQEVMPAPDTIVCCGNMFKKIMIQEGFFKKNIVVGPSFRYDYLYKLRKEYDINKLTIDNNKIIILIAGVENNKITNALIKNVYTALKNDNNISIWFKPHPNMKKNHIDKIINDIYVLNKSIKVIDKPIQQILLEVNCFIAISTGAIFDALCLGIPVIRVRGNNDIIIDPADWLLDRDIHFIAGNISEIKNQFNKINNLTKEDKGKLYREGEIILNECFSPINKNGTNEINEEIFKEFYN